MVIRQKDSQIEDVVNKYIRLGWKPLGGVTCIENSFSRTYLAQAMVKE